MQKHTPAPPCQVKRYPTMAISTPGTLAGTVSSLLMKEYPPAVLTIGKPFPAF
ncbi:MAG: hypothetical protein U9R04_03280 [Chloroflexota bacterium]|nr:hypothetical protein [Chloroflexota bacterium]